MPATGIDLPEQAFPHEDVFVPSRVRELSGQLILRIDTNDSAIAFRVDLAARPKIGHGPPVGAVRAERQPQGRVFLKTLPLRSRQLGFLMADEVDDVPGTQGLQGRTVKRARIAHM